MKAKYKEDDIVNMAVLNEMIRTTCLTKRSDEEELTAEDMNELDQISDPPVGAYRYCMGGGKSYIKVSKGIWFPYDKRKREVIMPDGSRKCVDDVLAVVAVKVGQEKRKSAIIK